MMKYMKYNKGYDVACSRCFKIYKKDCHSECPECGKRNGRVGGDKRRIEAVTERELNNLFMGGNCSDVKRSKYLLIG